MWNINKDLKHTCQISQIPYNIKSHSFRINMVSKLLQKTSAHNAADIRGIKRFTILESVELMIVEPLQLVIAKSI